MHTYTYISIYLHKFICAYELKHFFNYTTGVYLSAVTTTEQMDLPKL